MTITDNQRSAIEASGNVLVMAGAGSGKTSTLVERCLYHVLHAGQPVSVTEMLIVTFTEAAATEVRGRIAERLERERAGAIPVAALRLERELALIESAHISTLHSFCLHLVREHFQELGLDPAIAVFREEQAAMFMQMAMDRVMERHFEAATKDAQRIHELIEVYAAGDEEKIRALVLRLHKYTQTLARPAAWLSEQLARLQQELPALWREWLNDALVDWCDRWTPTLERLTKNNFANQFSQRVRAAPQTGPKQFAALFADIAAAVDPVPKGYASHRDEIADFFEEAAFLGTLLPQTGKPDPLAEDWEWVRAHVEALLRLTQEFAGEYGRLKRDHASLDFHDLEQFTLDLLTGKDRAVLTPIALHYRRKFTLIFVDEYQDINAAQDAILRALAREKTEANRFLVGDVKQSIYRFRLADPAIFQNYHAKWRHDSSHGQVITLSENFRSPEPLLDFVNAVFGSLMKKDLGGVEYDADARLRPGDSERPPPAKPCVDVHFRLTEKQQPPDDEEEENATEAELDARLVAQRLQALHASGHQIWDRNEKKMRAAAWGDMVVLLRSPRSRADTYLKEFARAGVPLQAERGGLYDSVEVSDLLSLLQLLDNPLQDVPLLAVLRSPLVGLSLDHLALIRADVPRELFWTALKRWHELQRSNPQSQAAWMKVDLFFDRFARWRKMARHSALSARIESVLNETQYADWLLTQPRAAQRQANVRRFVALAGQFDPMQRQGLQRFLRFVDAQRKAVVDTEPESAENVDAVRLMSIHKSKGLEFPVVAVASLGTRFNCDELHESILLDETYGLCAQVKPPGCGASYPSLPWWLAKRQQRRALIGEELRLLYVAMTRARDTLLLFGTASRKTAQEKWPELELDVVTIEKASSPIGWIGPWCARQTSARWCEATEGETPLFRWHLHCNGAAPAIAAAVQMCLPIKPPVDAAQLAELVRRMEWKYPSPQAARESAKLSVTALREANEEAAVPFGPRSVFKTRRDRSQLTAAEIGTAHHLFLQAMDLKQPGIRDHLRAEATAMVEEQILSPEQAEALDFNAIAAFWTSPAGQKILSASADVHREIPFSARFTRDDLVKVELATSLPEGEFVVVQGTIDLAVIRSDEMWILDFKTDALKESDVTFALNNYAPQLRLYASALSRIYQRPVTNRWLHFLTLGRTVEV
jgi:ATP-dependent helicase/nuclease subunit A